MLNDENKTTTFAVPPDFKTGSTIADAAVGDHHWTNDGNSAGNIMPMSKAIVSLRSTSDSKLLVKWNGTASASEWDVEITPGNFVPSPDFIKVRNVSIYSDGAVATFGTEYQVVAWI